MDRIVRHSPSALAIFGYIIWFLILVRLLAIATNDESSNPTGWIGFHLGVGLCLLALLGLPYFVERIRAKRRATSISWFLIMMWTTIMALLLTVGGIYNRLQSTVTLEATASPKPQPTQTAAKPPARNLVETLPYERRAWSGNVFDKFDSVQAIEAKARSIPQLSGQRAWAAVIAWQAYFVRSGDREANVALYMAVDGVLEGIKANRGICWPGETVIVSAEQASPEIPTGSQFVVDDCDRAP